MSTFPNPIPPPDLGKSTAGTSVLKDKDQMTLDDLKAKANEVRQQREMLDKACSALRNALADREDLERWIATVAQAERMYASKGTFTAFVESYTQFNTARKERMKRFMESP